MLMLEHYVGKVFHLVSSLHSFLFKYEKTLFITTLIATAEKTEVQPLAMLVQSFIYSSIQFSQF